MKFNWESPRKWLVDMNPDLNDVHQMAQPLKIHTQMILRSYFRPLMLLMDSRNWVPGLNTDTPLTGRQTSIPPQCREHSEGRAVRCGGDREMLPAGRKRGCLHSSRAPNMQKRSLVRPSVDMGEPFGCGSKFNRRGYADFGPCFHLPGFHFGTGFLSHSHMREPFVKPKRRRLGQVGHTDERMGVLGNQRESTKTGGEVPYVKTHSCHTAPLGPTKWSDPSPQNSNNSQQQPAGGFLSLWGGGHKFEPSHAAKWDGAHFLRAIQCNDPKSKLMLPITTGILTLYT